MTADLTPHLSRDLVGSRDLEGTYTRVMVALECIIGQAARAGDRQLLGVACEAWERRWARWALVDVIVSAGWRGHRSEPTWTDDEARELVERARYRRNRAKLAHQADTLWIALAATPLSTRDWQRLKWATQPLEIGAPRGWYVEVVG